ncbi:Cullin protein neddylation domain-containing protein [Mycena galopus ATCC 62051]|nr:Cullin protein neddylation domain-containing protein [Mycena galopus ATCC 62051]
MRATWRERNIPEYLKKAETRLRKEEERYLHAKTRKELVGRCESVPSRAHAPRMWVHFRYLHLPAPPRLPTYALPIPHFLPAVSLFIPFRHTSSSPPAFPLLHSHTSLRFALLDFDADEDLQRMYTLLARIPEGLEPLRKKFEAHVKTAGLRAVDALVGANAFQTFHTIELPKWLIHGVSASDEPEASMISKLKEACGFEYTNKLQWMFTDMSRSKDLTDSFKERMAQNHDDMDIAFSIMPLTRPTHDFLLPPELLPTFERFTRYYQTKMPSPYPYQLSRRLTNTFRRDAALGPQADVAAQLLEERAADELHGEPEVHSDDDGAAGGDEDLDGDSVAGPGAARQAKVLVNDEKERYDLNPGFKSKKIRVNLNLPIKAEKANEKDDVLKAVDEDRKYVIQATIVRIMKARKTMKNQALIQEVISQISQRFAPKIPDIKKAIETLLEKEYIERVDGSKDTFAFIESMLRALEADRIRAALLETRISDLASSITALRLEQAFLQARLQAYVHPVLTLPAEIGSQINNGTANRPMLPNLQEDRTRAAFLDA